MGSKITTPVFRVSFPQVFEAKSFDGGEPKFSTSMIWPKGTDLSALERIVQEAVKEKWGNKPPANWKHPLRDGAEKEGLGGYGKDTVFASASTKTRPGLVDRDLSKIVDAEDFYPGCYARATITAFAYDKKGNKGVAFGLHNLQKVRDGDRLDSRTAAEEDFQPVDVTDAAGDEDFLG